MHQAAPGPPPPARPGLPKEDPSRVHLIPVHKRSIPLNPNGGLMCVVFVLQSQKSKLNSFRDGFCLQVVLEGLTSKYHIVPVQPQGPYTEGEKGIPVDSQRGRRTSVTTIISDPSHGVVSKESIRGHGRMERIPKVLRNRTVP